MFASPEARSEGQYELLMFVSILKLFCGITIVSIGLHFILSLDITCIA